MGEVALSALLASSFGIVADAHGLVIGRPGGALAGLIRMRLAPRALSATLLATFLAALTGLLGVAGVAGGPSADLLTSCHRGIAER